MIWIRTWKADPRAAAIADRHYPKRKKGSRQFAPPARHVLPYIDRDAQALWVTIWPDYELTQHGLGDSWICSRFRNERPPGSLRSSDLILEALAATRDELGAPPSGGTLTFVDEDEVSSPNPGYCFLCAGFVRLPIRTKYRKLHVLRLAPEDHPDPAPPLARLRPGCGTEALAI